MKKFCMAFLPYLRLRRLLRGLHCTGGRSGRVGSNVGFGGEFLATSVSTVSSAVGVALAATGAVMVLIPGPPQPQPPVPSNKYVSPK